MVVIGVYISKISSRKDGSWTVSIETNELPPEKVTELAQMHNSYGVMAFKQSTFTHSETTALDSVDADLPAGISPSQRMRNVLYKLYLQSPEGYKTFQPYYEAKMDKMTKKLISLLVDL